MIQKLSKVSSWIAILVVLFVCISRANERAVWKNDTLIRSDAIHYYGYLPAALLHQDMSMSYLDTLTAEGAKGMHLLFETTKDDKRHFKMWAGEALMLSPFFMVGHALTLWNGEQAHGYGVHYYMAIAFGAWFYLCLGLVCIRASLRRLGFKDGVIATTILVLGLGTNLLYYSSVEMVMSHVYSFFLIALFSYLMLRWYETPNVRISIFLGTILGLLILTRPTNGIIVFPALLWGVYSFSSFRKHFHFLLHKRSLILIILLCAGSIVFIQPLLWYWGTGHWWINSYGDENFFWNDPQFIKVLFSYRKGWLIYSPLLLLVITGLFFGWKKYRGLHLPLAVYFLFNLYVISSWWCWWYGGSMGHRAFIESTALLAIPLALSLNFVLRSWVVIPSLAVLGFAFGMNFHMHDQYELGILHYDSMTKASYWEVLLNEKPGPTYWQNMDPPSYWNRRLGNSEEEPFRRALSYLKNEPKSKEEFPCLMLDTALADYFPGKEPTVLIVDARVECKDTLYAEEDLYLVLSIYNYDKNKEILYEVIPLTSFQRDAAGLIHVYLRKELRFINDPDARLKVYLRNVRLRELKVVEAGIGQEIN